MLKAKLEKLKIQFKETYQKNKHLKAYSKGVLVNNKLSFLKKLPKGIRAVCSVILDFMEARVGTDPTRQDYYMIVFASQEEIAEMLGYSREYISKCISMMSRTKDCPFRKVRQGLGKSNYYVMEEKKEFIALLTEIASTELDIKREENNHKSDKRNFLNNKSTGTRRTKGSFGNFEQRNYDFKDLERKLLGWDLQTD